ncbi:MAG: LCP family protein [Eggerthellaceae bacterium]|nr:LCP family protein [Eggerthellaceae bacterium]
MSRGKKIAIAVIVVALLAAVTALGLYVYKEAQKQAINEDLRLSQEEELKVQEVLTQKSEEAKNVFDEPFTVLLLGSDARADDPDMGARTDTIILVRVDPTINRVSMVSIPRDTRIEIEGQGVQKFNAAYTYGGPSGTIAAVKDLTGVDIDHYAEINFEGLVGLVDAIGGIDVEVDEEINDEDAGGHIDKGKQHLDGEHALILARSRAYVDGDYTRQVNQRKVIMAIINKALTAPATELSGLIKASTKFLKTDKGIDFDFIYDLADHIRHNNDYPVEIFTASLPSSTATIDQVSYVIADTAGVKEMMKMFMAGKDVSKGVTESSINEDIIAANGGRPLESNTGAVGPTYSEDGDYVIDEVDYNTSPELYEEDYEQNGQNDVGDGESVDYSIEEGENGEAENVEE